MATIKVKLRKSLVEGKPGVIYYQIIHNRKTVQITTKLKILPSHWDSDNETLSVSAFGFIISDLSYILKDERVEAENSFLASETVSVLLIPDIVFFSLSTVTPVSLVSMSAKVYL